MENVVVAEVNSDTPGNVQAARLLINMMSRSVSEPYLSRDIQQTNDSLYGIEGKIFFTLEDAIVRLKARKIRMRRGIS